MEKKTWNEEEERAGENRTEEERNEMSFPHSLQVFLLILSFMTSIPKQPSISFPRPPSSPNQMADNFCFKFILWKESILLPSYSLFLFYFLKPHLQMPFPFKSCILPTWRSKWM